TTAIVVYLQGIFPLPANRARACRLARQVARLLGSCALRALTRSQMATSVAGDYSAKSITVLEGLAAVRNTPGMYIGSTGHRGLHHLIWEGGDNAVDEGLAGFCDHIEVTLTADGGVRVADNGRGIPVDEHPIERRS